MNVFQRAEANFEDFQDIFALDIKLYIILEHICQASNWFLIIWKHVISIKSTYRVKYFIISIGEFFKQIEMNQIGLLVPGGS